MTRAAAELVRIRELNGGMLTAAAVVEASRPEASYFHGRFDWDDTEAAEKWRIHQARNLIVTIEVQWKDKKTGQVYNLQEYVNLTTDRVSKNPHYEELLVVLDNPAKRAQLLADAMAELTHFEKKYGMLKELADIFAAMRRYRGRHDRD